jgi:hypothetical protein
MSSSTGIPQFTIKDYDNLASQPTQILKPLKKHQLASLYHCQKLEERNPIIGPSSELNLKIGVLSDIVGAGKSLVMLSLIANNKTLVEKSIPQFTMHCDSYASYIKKRSKSLDRIKIDTNILVIPHTIRHQWIGYINEDTSGITYLSIDAKHIRKIIDDNKVKEFIDTLSNYDVIILKNTVYADFLSMIGYNKYIFNRVIFDEADSLLKVTTPIDANFSWLVTSTPNKLFSSSSSLIKYTFSEYHGWNKILDVAIVKNQDHIVKQSFNLETPLRQDIVCKARHHIAKILSGLVSEQIVNMIHADNINGAIEKIDCEMADEDNIVTVVTSKLMMELHNKKEELKYVQGKIYQTEKSKDNAIERIENDIKILQHQISLIEERMKEEDVCNICYGDFESQVVLKCCQHAYCFQCIMIWLNKNPKCPYCKSDITKSDLVLLKDKDMDHGMHTGQDEPTTSGELPRKIDKVIEIISNPGKFLIFASYDGSFGDIKNTLIEKNIKYGQLMGSGSHIEKIIREYKNGDLNVILLNSTHCGAGFNLENTTDVILYHKMIQRDEIQSIGRAQRFGRKSQLKIWQMIYADEY